MRLAITLLIILLCVWSGASLRFGKADPFAAASPTNLAQEKTSEALERYRAEFTRLRGPTDALRRGSEANALFTDIVGRVMIDYVRPKDASVLINDAVTGLREAVEEMPEAGDVALVEASLNHMLSAMDSYSSYLNADEFNELQAHTKGEFGGLGLELTFDNEADGIKVVSPIDGTPADRAGVLAGDLITHLDGDDIKGVSLHDAVMRMRGRPGTRIVLTVRRPLGTDRGIVIPIVRDIIRIDPVRYRLERDAGGDVGYIRITTFNEKTAHQLDRALSDLYRQGGPRLAGLVLDLRNNPGGLLDQAVLVTDRFIDSGQRIVSVRGRDSDHSRIYNARWEDQVPDRPIVVLINRGSASASEIVAAALQDHRRALLIGDRTYGKGSVQTVSPLIGGGALRLTTARYYRPTDSLVDCYGVHPNLVVTPPRPADAPTAVVDDRSRCAADFPAPPPPATYSKDRLCPRTVLDRPRANEDDPVLECAVEAVRDSLRAERTSPWQSSLTPLSDQETSGWAKTTLR